MNNPIIKLLRVGYFDMYNTTQDLNVVNMGFNSIPCLIRSFLMSRVVGVMFSIRRNLSSTALEFIAESRIEKHDMGFVSNSSVRPLNFAN
jgi:hypothetical protein